MLKFANRCDSSLETSLTVSPSIQQTSTLNHSQNNSSFESNCTLVEEEIVSSMKEYDHTHDKNKNNNKNDKTNSVSISVNCQNEPKLQNSSNEQISSPFINSEFQDTSTFNYVGGTNIVSSSSTNGYNWFDSNPDFIPNNSAPFKRSTSNTTIFQSYSFSSNNLTELNCVDPSTLTLLPIHNKHNTLSIQTTISTLPLKTNSNQNLKSTPEEVVKMRRDRNKLAAGKCREKRKETLSGQKKMILETQTMCEEMQLRVTELNEANTYCRFMLDYYFGGL